MSQAKQQPAATRVSVRLDHDELEQVKQFVKEQGFDSVAAWFRDAIGLPERRRHVGIVNENETEDNKGG